jgi:hypothetical protein
VLLCFLCFCAFAGVCVTWLVSVAKVQRSAYVAGRAMSAARELPVRFVHLAVMQAPPGLNSRACASAEPPSDADPANEDHLEQLYGAVSGRVEAGALVGECDQV